MVKLLLICWEFQEAYTFFRYIISGILLFNFFITFISSLKIRAIVQYKKAHALRNYNELMFIQEIIGRGHEDQLRESTVGENFNGRDESSKFILKVNFTWWIFRCVLRVHVSTEELSAVTESNISQGKYEIELYNIWVQTSNPMFSCTVHSTFTLMWHD